MPRFRLVFSVGLALPLVGCVTNNATTQLVPSNHLGNQPVVQPATKVSHSPASEEAAMRVGLVGQKLLLANQRLGVRPVFRTVGSPQAEVFHRGTTEVVITEGLVKQCATEGQLAAVLAVEIGKMISERETLAAPQTRQPEHEPPIEMRVGNDNAGSYGAADQVRAAELAKYEKERRRPTASLAPPPEPQTLARTYLTRAGFAAAELTAAEPILKAANANCTLEKQFTAPVPTRPWMQ